MAHVVELTKKSEKFLKKSDKENQKRIKKKLIDLSENLRLGKSLTANLAGLWSLRFGKFRAIYRIFESKLVVLVLEISHRKNAY